MKITKRGKGRYTGCIGLQQAYHFYRKETKAARKTNPRVEKGTYIKIISMFNKFIIDRVVNHGEEYKMPMRLGILRPRKRHTDLSIECVVLTRSKYWVVDEIKEKYLNPMNHPYKLSIFWDKRFARVPGIRSYFLKISKDVITDMYKAYNNKEVDYFEYKLKNDRG